LFGGVAVSSPAFAQQLDVSAAPVQAQQSSASDTPATVDDIVVTARGREERLKDVPVSASVLSTKEVQLAGANIANISAVVPTLRISRGGAGTGGSVSIRGIASSIANASLEQKVALNLDGVQLGRARFIASGMFDTRNIEVLRGPQSLYFGKNATAGVLSISSADPETTAGGYVRAGYETVAHEYQFEGAYSLPVSDNLRIRLSGRYADMTKGWMVNDAPVVFQTASNTFSGVPSSRNIPQVQSTMLRGVAVYHPNDQFDAALRVTVAHQDTPHSRGEMPAQVVCAPGLANAGVTFAGAEPWDDCRLNNHTVLGVLPPEQTTNYPEAGNGTGNSSSRSTIASLTMNYRFGDLTLTSVTGLATLDYREIGDAAGSAYTYAWGGEAEDYKQYSQELRLASNFDGRLNFSVGGLVSKADKHFGGCGILLPGIAVDRGRSNSFCRDYRGGTETASVFAQGIYKLSETLTLTAGARFTHEESDGTLGNIFVNRNQALSFLLPEGRFVSNKVSFDNLSPEVTLTWRPSSDIMIYTAYRTASLAGGVSIPTTITAGFTNDNIVFQPEDAKSYEAGARFTLLDGRLTTSATAFRTDYKDLQVSALDPNTLGYILRNVGAARTDGVELAANYHATPNLRFRIDATYANARYISFPNAQCYGGQTAAQECVGTPATQDLSGKQLPRAPELVASLGVFYTRPVGDDLDLNINGNVRYNSDYNYVETNNPVGHQDAFATVDLSASLVSSVWEFGVVGRNLTNEYYGMSGIDQPRGRNGQVFAVAARPREVVFQLTRRF